MSDDNVGKTSEEGQFPVPSWVKDLPEEEVFFNEDGYPVDACGELYLDYYLDSDDDRKYDDDGHPIVDTSEWEDDVDATPDPKPAEALGRLASDEELAQLREKLVEHSPLPSLEKQQRKASRSEAMEHYTRTVE